MPLGSSFWNAAGDGCRWIHNTVAYRIGFFFSGESKPRVGILGWKGFQESYSLGGDSNNAASNESIYDTGYFFAANNSTIPTGAPTGVAIVSKAIQLASVGSGGSTAPKPQWKEIKIGPSSSAIVQGELQPNNNATAIYRAIYQNGFLDNLGGTATNFTSFGGQRDILMRFGQLPPGLLAGASETRAWFWHYNPWAWFGTVPQVIADIVMKAGLDVEYINTEAFDTAHDAYDLSTGDIPFSSAADATRLPSWPGCATKFEIGCSRKIGEQVINLILDCAFHARDMYYVDESGKFSVSSFTRQPSHIGLSLIDGVINFVSWVMTTNYIFNTSICGWGSGVRVSGDPSAEVGAGEFMVNSEPDLRSYTGSKLFASYENVVSVAKHGKVSLLGGDRIVTVGGKSKNIRLAHFPFLFDKHANGVSLIPHVHGFAVSDGIARRVITISQDFRALDWGIGAKLTGVSVTDDAATIADCRCIERAYDFDRLTVESVLMEVPPNT